jgi:ATP-dependent helicase/nuclease subunit B
VLAWLRALRPEATTDDGLDALKHLGADPGSHRALESRWRRAGWRRLDQAGAAVHATDVGVRDPRATASAVRPAGEEPDGCSAWGALRDARLAWSSWVSTAHTVAVGTWLERLRATLTACGLLDRLEHDEAGRAVLQALALDDPGRLRDLGAAAQDESFGEREFVAWVDATLEASSFYPEAGGAADVVIVPLSVMPMHPFAAVVMPGGDHRHLGAAPRPSPLLDDGVAQALGLPCRREAMLREAWAFAWAIAAPSVTVLWRRQDGGERLGASPLVQRLALAHERAGRGPLPAIPEPLERRTLERRPQGRGQAVVRVPWPARLSATQAAALRECPYRFHVQVLLRLREVDELDEPPDRRVFGEWLHGVLDRLHREAPPGETRPERVARLVDLGRAGLAALRCDPDEFALFEAGLVPFAERYVDWWLRRESEGWTWQDGEVSLEAAPVACAPIVLHGRLDRIDRRSGEDRIAILDYKVTSSQRLRERVRAPAEDTQLLFYAALLRHALPDAARDWLPPPGEPDRWEAGYVALDDTQGIGLHRHADIGPDAEAYLAALGHDLRRLRDGAPARALGEGAACERCAARGLCRRDHARQGTLAALT